MPEYPFEPEKIFAVLHEHSVLYVLIGALAATLHGSPLRTNDADICPARDEHNLERLAFALIEMDARLRVEGEPDGVPFVIDAVSLRNAEILTMTTRFGHLDIATTPAGTGGYDDLKREAVEFEIDGLPVTTASLLDVIRSKEAVARGKDLNHLPLLREMLDRWGEHPSSG